MENFCFIKDKIWNSVAETFIDCTLEWGDRRCRSETVRKAWALIIAYVTEKIKHGNSEEVFHSGQMGRIKSLKRFDNLKNVLSYFLTFE